MPSKTTSRKKTAVRRNTNSGTDITALLAHDHKVVKRLLNQLDQTTERATTRREELFKQVENELKMHTRIEEEIFYPAFRDAVKKADQDMYYEALEEHHIVDVVLAEMKSADTESEEFGAKAKVLKDLVLHHAEEEEEPQMFVKARRVMNKQKLNELGKQMQARKQELGAGIMTRVARTAGATLGKIMNGGKGRAA
jgi:hemerythrin-like domain-containing protein